MEASSAWASGVNGSGGAGAGWGWWPYSWGAAAALWGAGGLLIALTVAGNALVALAVLRSRALRAPQHLFVASLAGADVLVGALVMPFSLAHELMGGWAFGAGWCRAYLALDVLLCTASIAHLCAISLDRYWAVTRALQYGRRRTARRVRAALAAAWLLAAAVSCPPLLAAPPTTPPDDDAAPPLCRLNDQTWYILASCAASFFAPCLVMLLVYGRLYRVARRRARARQRPTPDGAAPAQPPQAAEREESSASEGRRRRRRRPHAAAASLSLSSRRASGRSVGRGSGREQRLTFVLGVVLGAFVVCWAPFFFSYSLYGICREACRVPEPLFKCFFWMGYCNSSLNPVIYTVFNRDFRRSFKHILFGGRRRRRRKKTLSLH
uniref:alpha-2C adrenergic receptor n=1 Tax=Euleptes europaea TaxID=460621 RepID=UPI002542103E|nr:alpha-2C adrenergic receptor [Euleptes europaea]